MRGDQAGGLAVGISKELAGHAEPGEVLLTNTVKDLISGADFEFSTRVACNLAEMPDCQLFAVK